jgi:hypothetical protein
MNSKQSELAEYFRVETQFFPDHVGHTTYSSDPSARWRKTEEKWYIVKEIGRGGFGTVRLEKELEGRLRAVKVINKRQLDPQIDYGRELQAMGMLSKVSSSRALEDFSTLLTRTGYSIGRYLWTSMGGSRMTTMFISPWSISSTGTLRNIFKRLEPNRTREILQSSFSKA